MNTYNNLPYKLRAVSHLFTRLFFSAPASVKSHAHVHIHPVHVHDLEVCNKKRIRVPTKFNVIRV
jgi:hypothetical protein